MHGVLAILFLAVSMTMLTFPSVAGTMAFMFTVHAYAVGTMLMCLGVYLIRRYKYGFIPGTALIIIGLGIYQPYVSFVIGHMLGSMLADLLRKKKNGRETLIIGIKYAAVAMIPFSLAFVYFMASNAPFSILMAFAYVLVYSVALMLLEIAIDACQSSSVGNKAVNIVKKELQQSYLVVCYYRHIQDVYCL